MALFLELDPGDAVRIGDNVVRLEVKSGKRARLAITSAEDVKLEKAGVTPPAALQRNAPARAAAAAATPAPRKSVFVRAG